MLTLNNSHFPKELVNLGLLLNSLTFFLVTWGPKQLPYTTRNVISSKLAGVLSKFLIFILSTGLKVSKYRKQFMMSKLRPKNEPTSLSWQFFLLRIVSLVHFLEEVLTSSIAFEIYWPLVGFVLKQPRTVNFHGALSSAEKKRNKQLKVFLL